MLFALSVSGVLTPRLRGDDPDGLQETLCFSGEVFSEQPRRRGTREPRQILKQTFPGSRTLRKAKLSLNFSKFRDDAVEVVGEVARRAGEG